jgi:hypothetical protein
MYFFLCSGSTYSSKLDGTTFTSIVPSGDFDDTGVAVDGA